MDPSRFVLQRGDRILRLEKRPMELLILLVEKRGELVSREQAAQRLWGVDVFVDVDHGINTAVRKVRMALRDDPEEPRFIETVVGKGYRFSAEVTCDGNGEPHEGLAEPKPEVQSVPAPDACDAAANVAVAPQIVSPKRKWSLVLRATLVAGVVLAALLIGLRWRVRQASQPAIHSLAVLPLENLTGDASQEYFADGMTEALITDLAQIGTLRVISRTSTMRYKGTRKSLPDIARELGVDGIIEGAVARSGKRVRITSQLIYAPADLHLWARSYERDLQDVLSLQAEVAQAIADEVKAAVGPEAGAHLRARSTVNPDAYEANLKGRYFWNKRASEALPIAMEYFQQAIGKDPGYAPAYVGLADTYTQLANWGLNPPREVMPRAKAAALRALEIDDQLAEAHVSVGMVLMVYDWNWSDAASHLKRALALNPASPPAHLWYSMYLARFGRPDEALEEIKRAVDLDPVSPDTNHHLAMILRAAGRYKDAVEQERRVLELDAGFPPAHFVLADTYEAQGMHPQALAEIKNVSLAPGADRSMVLGFLAYVHARAGDRSQALRALGELMAVSRQRCVFSNDVAPAYFVLGDRARALQCVREAVEERAIYIPWVRISPKWAPLLSDARFSGLVRGLGLPE